ncbi:MULTISPECIES: YbaN family protein [Halomonas]|uniref:Inner membrane protein n=1 Tax=Halomonas chromatireducens TaxID=507626 RepID=A0A109UL42_9GAMM|nr:MULTISPECIES: YbaN family protein [Halomonas]AMC99931.1 Inner membrane protein YbaN [Halomonas chromatireducens]MBZ0328822.1 YbaN family protein [Halomonas sp. ANAO-440]
MHSLRRAAYIALAWVSFCLGVIGVFVPLMPTTCFMLLAVWAASRGSPRFALWIREHPRFGPAVVAWEGERAIPRHAKWLAGAMLSFSILVLLFTLSVVWLKVTLVTGLVLLGLWIASRPEPRGLGAPPAQLVRR